MKKSINLWAFPYPQKMTLVQCLQLAKDAGFDGIELNYDLESDLSPKAGTSEFQQIRKRGRPHRHRDQRPVLVSVLAVPVDEQRSREARTRARAGRAMAQAAHDLGVENLLVVPAPCTFRGGTITSPCRMTCAITGPARPSRTW